ncbi:HlyD family efflux transporter periplasmic adaptor subunit, partial [Thermovenabulum sp.]
IEKKDYVEENEKVLKIIDNFNIYILAECKEKNLKKGRFYNMESSSGENFSAKLEKILGNGRLLFFVNEDLPGLYEKRKEKFKIILKGYEGITLPKSAIIRVGDKDGVFIKERDKLIYKPVEVIFEEGENVVVGGLKPGDIILVKRGLLWNIKEALMNFF